MPKIFDGLTNWSCCCFQGFTQYQLTLQSIVKYKYKP